MSTTYDSAILDTTPYERMRTIERIDESLQDAQRLRYIFGTEPMDMPNFVTMDYEC